MIGCCSNKSLVAGIITGAYAMGFDFLWHGKLLTADYEATKALWRPMEQMQALWPWCIVFHLAMGILVAGGFACWRARTTVGAIGSSTCPYRKSMAFGLWLGLLLGLPQTMAYMSLPLESPHLTLMWGVGEVVKWTLAGVLLNKLYGKTNA